MYSGGPEPHPALAAPWVALAIHVQLAGIEQQLLEKVGNEQMQQAKASLSIMNAQVAAIEQTASGKADAEQVQQVNSIVNGIQSKVAGVEQVLQQKADALQVYKIDECLTTLKKEKIPNIENVASTGAHKLAEGKNIWPTPHLTGYHTPQGH